MYQMPTELDRADVGFQGAAVKPGTRLSFRTEILKIGNSYHGRAL